MEIYQDGVTVNILPDGAHCKVDEARRSPIDVEECPIGCDICAADCYFYEED